MSVIRQVLISAQPTTFNKVESIALPTEAIHSTAYSQLRGREGRSARRTMAFATTNASPPRTCHMPKCSTPEGDYLPHAKCSTPEGDYLPHAKCSTPEGDYLPYAEMLHSGRRLPAACEMLHPGREKPHAEMLPPGRESRMQNAPPRKGFTSNKFHAKIKKRK